MERDLAALVTRFTSLSTYTRDYCCVFALFSLFPHKGGWVANASVLENRLRAFPSSNPVA